MAAWHSTGQQQQIFLSIRESWLSDAHVQTTTAAAHLVLKGLPIDGLAARAVALGEVAALQHELRWWVYVTIGTPRWWAGR